LPVIDEHHVVIVGGGFAGLNAARGLKRAPVRVTLIDRRNFHLFQPLLYQVATGGLSPGDIASPLRGVLKRQRNAAVLLAEVVDVDPAARRLILSDGELDYDTLVVATGASHSYFGHQEWQPLAPGLKSVEDATEIRRRIFLAFEAAEREPNPARRRGWLTFVIIGGGPTGVELAGALGEIANDTLKHDFRSINPAEAHILLLEGVDRVLPPYPPELSQRAARALARLGVTVRASTLVTDIDTESVSVRSREASERIAARTVIWAAGVQASPLGRALSRRTEAPLDRIGRVIVEPDLTVPGRPEIFVIGDLAHARDESGSALPGVAPVAIQQGKYVAKTIQRRLRHLEAAPFRYRHVGNMAVIGRAAAVADFGRVRFGGRLAWLLWLFVHLMNLVEFENRVLVFIQWAWNYLTWNRGARLITGESPLPLEIEREERSRR
jgi:NADH dehydrogenase